MATASKFQHQFKKNKNAIKFITAIEAEATITLHNPIVHSENPEHALMTQE